MKNDGTNIFLLNSLNLPVINDLDELSNKLGLSKRIIYLLSRKNEKFYTKILIPKKSGSMREILQPSYVLKITQKWILKEILEKIITSKEAMAFKAGSSFGIKSNAERHRYSLYILKIDFKDFFTSIKRYKVFSVFRKIGYNNLIANILTNICIYQDYLPQGAVTSPYLSNLVCYEFDNFIRNICEKREIVYTRYADDLIFSCDNISELRKLEKKIIDISFKNGFTVNTEKTKYMAPNRRKSVTSITINDEKIKANKEIKRKLRSMIYNSINNSDYSNNQKIRGYVAFIKSIEPNYKNKILSYIKNIVNNGTLDTPEKTEQYNKNKIYMELEDFEFLEEEMEFNTIYTSM